MQDTEPHQMQTQAITNQKLNFAILDELKDQLPSLLFEQMEEAGSLPHRLDWEGKYHRQSFEELKQKFPDQGCEMLRAKFENAADGKDGANPAHQIDSEVLDSAPRRNEDLQVRLFNQLKYQNFLSVEEWDERTIEKLRAEEELRSFKRQKTVFGHQLHQEGVGAPIFNVIFDRTGEFVVSGSDDGVGRFVKIWSRRNLILQKTLIGHTNVVTDLVVSPCNKFILSSGGEGHIIIWDLATGFEVERLTEHQGTQINNIKFMETELDLKQSKEQAPFRKIWVITGSDDGKIVLYDLDSILNKYNQDGLSGFERKTRCKQKKTVEGPFSLVLFHEESYRPQSRRNKKVDSVAMTKDGLIIGGCSTGELMIWQCYLSDLYEHRVNPHFKGLFKIHKRSIHFCEFNMARGAQNLLMTASTDGQAVIWDLSPETKGASRNLENIFDKRNSKVIIEEPANKILCQVDTCAWSLKGRYALAVVSGKVNRDVRLVSSKIMVWDRILEGAPVDLTEQAGIILDTFSLVLAPHPTYEHILMSASSGGKVIIWDIRSRTILKQFTEYSIYTIERYTFNDSYDGKFSPDGSCFVTASKNGSLTLWSPDQVSLPFAATPVEQFCQFENEMSQRAPEGRQLICGINLIPNEIQPPRSLYGQELPEWTLEDAENNWNLRVEMCSQEEFFYQNILREGIENDMFNQPEDNREIDVEEEKKEQPPIEGLSNIEQDGSSHRTEDRNIGRQIRGRPRNGTPVRQRAHRTQYIDPDNSRFDDSNDEDYNQSESEDEEDPNDDGRGSAENSYNLGENYKPPQRQYASSNNFGFESNDNLNAQSRRRRRAQNREMIRSITPIESGPATRGRKRQLSNITDELMAEIGESDSDGYDFDCSEDNKRKSKRIGRLRRQEQSKCEQNDLEEEKVQFTSRGRQITKKVGQYRENSETESEMSGLNKRQRARGRQQRIIDEDEGMEESKGQEYKIITMRSNKHELCNLCKRSDQPLIYMANTNDPDEVFIVHQDCVERNSKSVYSVRDQVYKYVSKAVEQVNKEAKTCARCDTKNATIKCVSCPRWYHGHLCSRLWMIPAGGPAHKCVCLFCLNENNRDEYSSQSKHERENFEEIVGMERQKINKIPFDLERPPTNKYVPQRGDQVYYFFQGHEKMLNDYSCFFFDGSEARNEAFLPWKAFPSLKDNTLCYIKECEFQYPSFQTRHLLNKYHQVLNQNEQVLMKLILVSQHDGVEFSIQYLDTKSPPFIVPAFLIDSIAPQFEQLHQSNQLVDKMFKNTSRQLVKILNVSAIEPTLYPLSIWNTVFCEQQQERQLRRGSRQNNEDNQMYSNFWDIQFAPIDLSGSGSFTSEQQKEALSIIEKYIGENRSTNIFIDKVTHDIAPDYDNIIPIQMNISFICKRLQNGYYRQLDSLEGDIRMIYKNSHTYNGDEMDVTVKADKITMKLCSLIRQRFGQNNGMVPSSRRNGNLEEAKQKPFEQNDVGKMTVIIPKNPTLDIGVPSNIVKMQLAPGPGSSLKGLAKVASRQESSQDSFAPPEPAQPMMMAKKTRNSQRKNEVSHEIQVNDDCTPPSSDYAFDRKEGSSSTSMVMDGDSGEKFALGKRSMGRREMLSSNLEEVRITRSSKRLRME